ncbi:MAG: hypothetical protein IPL62_16955 [Caulobacteraceae bacterium]|nr:hypothetical protein [Caulobacteraceae bacterium]
MINVARALIVCFALAACQSALPSEPQLVGTVVTETQVTEINDQVAPAMLLGRWGLRGNCSNDIVISANGVFRSSANGAGTWVFESHMLTMTTGAGATQVWVGAIGSDQLVFANRDRSAETWQRCPQQ